MKRKYQEYWVLMVVFLIFIFQNSIDKIFFKYPKIDGNIIAKHINQNLEEENEALKEMVEFKMSLTGEYIVTKLKGRDIYDFTDTFTIYGGEDENIAVGDAVYNSEGLIGTISKVNKNSATVKLITNKLSNISVKINDTYGILKYSKGKLVVSNVTSNMEIKPGDLVYTSGLATIPGNIYIGSVLKSEVNSLGIEQIIEVKPAVDFNDIYYVVVEKNALSNS